LGPTALGVTALLIAWTLAAKAFSASGVVPTPWAVAEQLWADRAILPGNIWTTMREALLGYFWGNLAAILLAVLFAEFAAVERILLKLAIASYCAPLVAIAPILIVVLSPATAPKLRLQHSRSSSPRSSRRWSDFDPWMPSASILSAPRAAERGSSSASCGFRERCQVSSQGFASRRLRRSSAL
jgi:hypothetical protein